MVAGRPGVSGLHSRPDPAGVCRSPGNPGSLLRTAGGLRQLRQEQNHKWEASQAELRQLRQEQAQKWEANQAELRRLHEEIMAQNAKYDRGIGALGSRWGMQSDMESYAPTRF